MRWLRFTLVSMLLQAVGAADAANKFGRVAAGTLAPDLTAVTADKGEFRLADLKGQSVIVNFWTTNRGPVDVLASFHAQYHAEGVAVIGICTHATREEFDAWVAKHQAAIRYPLAWDPAGRNKAESLAQKHFGLGTFPATGVVDREGRVVGGFVGFGPSTPALLRGYLREAGLAIPRDDPSPAPAVLPPREDNVLKAGTVAPDFAAETLDGRTVRLSDYTGKIVVLDFWATWCGPCIASMPHTQQVAAATQGKGVVVLAACTSDTRAKFEDWLREHGAKYPDLVFANDPNGRDGPPEKYAERASVKLYGVNGIPCQFVIGRDGKIAEVIRGYSPGDQRLEQALAALGVTLAP